MFVATTMTKNYFFYLSNITNVGKTIITYNNKFTIFIGGMITISTWVVSPIPGSENTRWAASLSRALDCLSGDCDLTGLNGLYMGKYP
jgi:hypothetical protein